jgi:hypothetical protein
VPRPKLEIDPEQVQKLAMLQCTNVEIASFFNCDEGTIRKRFSDELRKGRESGKISLRRMQWKSCENGNVTMQIWLGKQYLGQSDNIMPQDEAKPIPLTDYRKQK